MTEQRRHVGIGDPPVNRTAGLNEDGRWGNEPSRRKRTKDSKVPLQFRVEPDVKVDWEAEADLRGGNLSHLLRHWIDLGLRAEKQALDATAVSGDDLVQQLERFTTLDLAEEVARRHREGD